MVIEIATLKALIIIAILLIVIAALIGYLLGFVKGFRKAKSIDDQILEELAEKSLNWRRSSNESN